MKNCKVSNYKSLSNEEMKLLNIYISEYNDIFQTILLYPPSEFIQNIIKRVELSLKKKFNEIPLIYKNRVENFLTEKIYSKDYKVAINAFKIIKNKIINNSNSKNIFNGKILEHCINDKKNGFYIHSCGEKFYIIKYKPLINLSNLEEEPKKNDYDFFLICEKCEMIYKSNLIKFHCNDLKIDFYSKIINNNENKKELPYATWKKYHCNAIINDTMKCPICKESLLFDKENNKLICIKCNKNVSPNKILWNCLICNKEFSCEVKEYNNLEFKNMKICIKNALINKEKAYPEIMGCDCNINYNNIKFYHNSNCKGELYFGEMNNKKIIVCSKCDSMGYYKYFNWTCPICQKKFKVKNIIKNKNKNFNNNGNFILKNLSWIKEKEKDNFDEEFQYKSGRKNCGFSPSFKRGKNDNDEFISPNKNNVYASSIKKSKKQIQNDYSPYLNLNLKNLNSRINEIEESEIKNLENDFEKCCLSNNERYETENNINFKSSIYEKLNNKRKKSLNKNSASTASISENDSIQLEKSNIKHNKNNINNKEKEIKNIIELKEIIPEEEISKNPKFEISDYKIKEKIGEGSFGQIFKVESPDNKLYAMKKIVATSKKDIENLQHEYDILDDINKSGKKIDLISIIGKQNKQLDPTTFVLYVVMELATSDWEKEIEKRRKNKKYYKEKELIKILHKLIITFSQLQKINISHRDIKPQNILFFKENNSYKLADFGEAKELQNNILITSKQTLRGTELFMSPILFQALRNKNKYVKLVNHNTFKSDVYSFGLMSFFVASLGYEGLYDIRELKNNSDIKIILNKYLKDFYSKDFINLIASMIDVDEKSRCDFIQLEKIFEEIDVEN